MKTRILLLAGGQSGEHEVSINSAKSVLEALPKDQFEITTRVISKQGRWLGAGESLQALSSGAAESGGELMLAGASSAGEFDVVFPLLHGPMGEDGTVQGLLTLGGIPFVGSGVLGSAAAMDKIMAKQVFAAAGLPQVPYAAALRSEWRAAPDAVRARAEGLGYPLFVKPANLGSSVGISKVRHPGELDAALNLAFSYDRRVILEAMTQGKPRELEVGILGNDAPRASVVGELSFDAEFYDYDTKYTEGRAQMHIPARVPAEIAEQVREYALTAYRALDCAGLARVDFFYLEDSGTVFINELNTMPGFTTTSMYPKLWEASGLSYSELVARLVELALEAR
ncbi:D-alanine-D-alanine ligase [Deinobacterium chartae]|uniref:D-alanine--D-alanine ligase n=1 Tax=Deinobacterium chartae TaxID=521158 RepID=A0A841I539_9DEIO|nr:D-alanine--D-alanine ligase family protein [Deinobacterium chartae]MBB6099548.1 D-alanine-D-alanine ligase [Deinobacterium chartae]